ncbi:MAG: acyltransferase family protein [Flavisolibacter sp.]
MKLGAEIQHWFGKAFNTQVLQKKRLQWVDYLRGIAIILVVYRHALFGIERSKIAIPTFLENANMIFYSFRMPLFFILSGIFISRSLAKKTVKQLIGIKFENLLYPYLVWAFIQVTLQVFFSHFTNSNRGLVDYTYILYHPRNLDQFWYLPALFNSSVVFLLVKTKLKPGVWSHLVLALLFYFSSPFFQSVSMISDWMEFYIFFVIGDAVSEIFFSPTSQKLFQSGKIFLVVLPFFIATQLYYMRHDIGGGTLNTDIVQIKQNYVDHAYDQFTFLFIALTGCLTMFNLAFLLQRFRVFPFLRVLGYHSLYIYVMHVIVTSVVRMILPHALGIHNPTVLLFSGIFFGVMVPVVVYNLLIKDNVGWFLFSLKKRKSKPQAVPEVRPSVVTM